MKPMAARHMETIAEPTATQRRFARAVHVLVAVACALAVGCSDDSAAPQRATGPAIAVTPATLVFNGEAWTADPPSQHPRIENKGDGFLGGLSADVVYAPGGAAGWLTSHLAGSAAPTELEVGVTTASVPSGEHRATINLFSASARNSPLQLPVTFVVAQPRPVVAWPAPIVHLYMEEAGAGPPVVVLPVVNAGSGSLGSLDASVTYQSGTGWLNVDLDTTAPTAHLTLGVFTPFLIGGSYAATVSVTSTTATNSPRDLPVFLHVVSPASPTDLEPAADWIHFHAVAGGPDPEPVSVPWMNNGGGLLGRVSLIGFTHHTLPPGWVRVDLNPTDVVFEPIVAGLPPGDHALTIEVSSENGGNERINVSCTVKPDY